MRLACLHLSFYLASWGLYRGSSFLLWKDYLVHHDMVNRILSLQHLRNIDFSKQCAAEIDGAMRGPGNRAKFLFRRDTSCL
jgi:hypothetical protein